MAIERAVSAVDARLQMSKPRADMASSKSRAIINSSSTIRARWRCANEHLAMVSPYSFLAVLPLVKQIASLCVPAQREEICIGMSAGGSASASKRTYKGGVTGLQFLIDGKRSSLRTL